MTAYRAVVKYAVNAAHKEKVAALRDGLQEVAAELIEEHGLSLEDVEDALDDAYRVAEISAEYVARYNAGQPS